MQNNIINLQHKSREQINAGGQKSNLGLTVAKEQQLRILALCYELA